MSLTRNGGQRRVKGVQPWCTPRRKAVLTVTSAAFPIEFVDGKATLKTLLRPDVAATASGVAHPERVRDFALVTNARRQLSAAVAADRKS